MSRQKEILEAIALRTKVDSGLINKSELDLAVLKLIEEGLWSDGQIASIVKFSRPYVWQIGSESGARINSPALGSGRLPRESLDLLLELSAVQGELTDANRTILRAALEMGCSSRMIAKLTDISLGAILYVQRTMPNREVVRRGPRAASVPE